MSFHFELMSMDLAEDLKTTSMLVMKMNLSSNVILEDHLQNQNQKKIEML